MKCYVDIETRSRTDLRKVGVYRYVEDPDFSILMMAWAFEDEPVRTALSADEIGSVLETPDVIFVAHNANF